MQKNKTVLLAGGLGNQMFQYAFAKFLQLKHGDKINFDLWEIKKRAEHNGSEIGDIFDIPLDECSYGNRFAYRGIHFFFLGKEWSARKIVKRFFNKDIKLKKGVLVEPNKFSKDFLKKSCSPTTEYIYGNFQNEKYFCQSEKDIRKIFAFPNFMNSKNINLFRQIKRTESVSVHVRRGDYLNYKNNYLTDLSSTDYYKTATNLLTSKIKNPHFYFFSDDIEWCKKKFSHLENTHFIDWNKRENSFRDMQLMSLCKHNIIANSTFSWWGAWLNKNKNKIIVAPERWFNGKKRMILPNSWILI